MTNPALQVSHLTKTYPAFKLDDVSFEVEAGTCTALIGENGSGKSTILRCLLSEIVPESGEIRFYGHNPKEEISTHALIGSCKDHLLFPEFFTPAMVSQLFARLYPLWDARGFEDFLQKQKISMNQPLKKMSRGMKAKVSLATAMHHQTPLLLLDEATSGLDPVVREEMLDALQEYMEDENRSILITSHISSDLERIADNIILISGGRIVLQQPKDELLNSLILAHLRKDQLDLIEPELILGIRRQPLQVDVLIKDREEFTARYPDYDWDPITLDDLVLMFSDKADQPLKGDHHA